MMMIIGGSLIAFITVIMTVMTTHRHGDDDARRR